jgi:hypothetical protein
MLRKEEGGRRKEEGRQGRQGGGNGREHFVAVTDR